MVRKGVLGVGITRLQHHYYSCTETETTMKCMCDIVCVCVYTCQIQQSDAEHRLKKPTGASAAQLGTEMDDDDVSNDLVAACPTFKNEIGGEWMPKGFLGSLRWVQEG